MPRDTLEQAVVHPGAAQPPSGENKECQEEADDTHDSGRVRWGKKLVNHPAEEAVQFVCVNGILVTKCVSNV